MKDAYILDSSVLLHDPSAIFQFPGDEVIIPIAVIEEIDGMKRREDEIGRKARQTSRLLDNLRRRGGLANGIELDNEGRLRVELNHQDAEDLPIFFDKTKADNRILAVALSLTKERSDFTEVHLVTKDINLRVKADALGVRSCDLPDSKVPIEEIYSGTAVMVVASEVIDRFYSKGSVEVKAILADSGLPEGSGQPEDRQPHGRQPSFYPNQFVHLVDSSGSQSALGRYWEGELVSLRALNADLSGVKARNREQRYAVELLMDDNVKLVSLIGKAGTGKTLLAVAAAIQKVLEERRYRKAVVSRPVFPLGKDIGYLPGEKEEKLRPWMQPIFDNLEFIFANRDKRESIMGIVTHLQDVGYLELEALTYIRGRSLSNQFLIVDEAQNLSPHEVLTIVTRAGEGTKIVLTGDPYQIDHPYLDSSSNGLVHVVERFKEESIAGHVTLIKGERSELAEIAARVL